MNLADGGQFLFDNMPMRPAQMVDELEDVAWYTLIHPNGRQIYLIPRLRRIEDEVPGVMG